MNNFIAQIIVIVAQLIVISATLSQYIHIVSNKNIKGLSGWTYTLIAGSTIAWGIYGVGQGIKVFYFSSFTLALIEFAILGHLYAVAKIRRRMEIYAITVGVSLTLLLTILPKYAGWVGLAYIALARLPQYRHLLVDKNLKGVSPLAHCLFILAALFTLIYANYFNLMPVIISASLSIFSSFFSLIMVAKKSVRAYN
jgi:uncharacterized protein with PQ loop repeat